MNYPLVGALVVALGQPVFAADMPAMPMDKMPMAFKATPAQLANVQVGQQVMFEFKSGGMAATLLSIEPIQQ